MMKLTMKNLLGILGCVGFVLSLPLFIFNVAHAAPYAQPYTAAFGTSQTGQAANVVYYVFDAAGTLRVGPASYVNSSGATVTGPNNEPVVKESFDYTGTGGTGAYYTVLPLDTSWGPLHVKAVITGQAGVVAVGSLLNRGADVADGYTPALPGTLSGGISANSAALTTANTGITTLTTRPAQTGDTFGLVSPLISGGKLTASALSNAPAGGSGGTVIVGGYAAGQDPYTLLMAGSFLTVPGDHTTSGTAETLTFKQMQAILLAVPASDNASTAPAPGSTATTSYYLAGLPAIAANLVYVSTVTYNAAGQQTGRTLKIASPFPSVQ